ncbi:hypothetical protein Tco_1416198 [Tanacetum coccineum]
MKRVGKGFSGRETPLFPTIVVHNQEEMGEGSTMPTDPHHTPIITQPSTSQPQRKQRHRKPKRKDTKIPQFSVPSDNVADEAVNEEMDDSLVRATTTPTGLDAEHDRGNIDKTRSKAILNEPSLKLKELMDFCTKLQQRGSYDDDIMFDVSDLAGEEVFVSKQRVPDSKKDDVVSTVVDAAQVNTVATTVKLKSAKPTTATSTSPKDKGLVIHKQEQAFTPIVSSHQPSQAKIQDNGKAKMIEPEPVKKLIEREKYEANIALKETWDDIQAKIEADYLLAERLQAREQEEFPIKERAKLFQQLLEKRRKHFAAKRAEEIRNRPPTRAQQRSIMCTYLKNMEGKKVKDLKNKSFDSIQKMFDKTFKRVNTFVNFRTELVEGSSKRAGIELEQEVIEKKKVDDVQETAKVDNDKETVELQSPMEVIPDEEEVAVDAIPLATKPPSIVDWKILKEGKINYFQYIRANGSSKRLELLLLVSTASLMLLVQKLLLLVLKVNAAGIKVTTAKRLQLLEEFMLTEKRSKTYQRKNKD